MPDVLVFELISLEEIYKKQKGPQPPPKLSPKLAAIFFLQEINKQELEVAHAGDLYDKAHGDSMRAEKALKAPGLDEFGFPPFFLGRGSDFQELPEKAWKSYMVCFFWVLFSGLFEGCGDFLVANCFFGARKDHLVALAIAKKRRDDLKRKADEVMASS